MPLLLKSIEEEATDCRAAFAGVKVGTPVWHCHHEILAERLLEPAEKRILYILENKNKEEQAIRLRLFRPIKGDARLDKILADWYEANAELKKANTEWLEASADFGKASARLDKASARWYKARAESDKAFRINHSTLCQTGCPWDGFTIFPTC
jgi:hypothetical protein